MASIDAKSQLFTSSARGDYKLYKMNLEEQKKTVEIKDINRRFWFDVAKYVLLFIGAIVAFFVLDLDKKYIEKTELVRQSDLDNLQQLIKNIETSTNSVDLQLKYLLYKKINTKRDYDLDVYTDSLINNRIAQLENIEEKINSIVNVKRKLLDLDLTENQRSQLNTELAILEYEINNKDNR